MRCLIEGKLFDTKSAQLILSCRTLYQQYDYYKTTLGNFVQINTPASEFRGEGSACVPIKSQIISESMMRSILSSHDMDKYEEVFGVDDVEML